jgi:enamine deaminase RidA (YjgF/YER057c/UK114 family)
LSKKRWVALAVVCAFFFSGCGSVESGKATDMAKFLEVASYRNSIYMKNFPTGTWVEVKGLALPEFMIEIELEAHKPRYASDE